MEILGIDIGGSGIKGAVVDTSAGRFLGERYRLDTPQPATPEKVADVISRVAAHFRWNGPIGCGFPAVIQKGVALTAANIDSSWIGTDVTHLFSAATGCAVTVLNDADAAGLAEITFGAGRNHTGVIIIVTIGTGLGTALFTDGKLVPNTELGHVVLNGKVAELYTSDAVRKRKRLTWAKWGKRFNLYLQRLEFLVSPDLIILGGGASKRLHKFSSYLDVRALIVPARLLNRAGIIGAALAAEQKRS